MPGSLVTIERRVPVRRLKSVDLPTFGRPTITTEGRFSGMSAGCLVSWQADKLALQFLTARQQVLQFVQRKVRFDFLLQFGQFLNQFAANGAFAQHGKATLRFLPRRFRGPLEHSPKK